MQLEAFGEMNKPQEQSFSRLSITRSFGYQVFQPGSLFNTSICGLRIAGWLSCTTGKPQCFKATIAQADANQLAALFKYQQSIATGYPEAYNQLPGIKNLQLQFELNRRELNTLMQAEKSTTCLNRYL